MKKFSVPDPVGRETRRDFVKKSAAVVAGSGVFGGILNAQASSKISIVTDASDPDWKTVPVRRAVEELRAAVEAKGVASEIHPQLSATGAADEVILIAKPGSALARALLERGGVSIPSAPESVGTVRGRAADRSVLLISGSDARGAVYGLLDLADRVRHAASPLAALQSVENGSESPANPIRSVTRYFESDVEDKSWYNDKLFWGPYLSMLVEHRFNRFSLGFGLGYNRPRDVHDAYFYFTYPFLFDVPGYNVRVPQLSNDERDRNWAMLRWISEETTARGLDFQVGLWTHAYRWIDSPNANYTVEGLTPENHAAYCRDALNKLLQECPAIKGITIRGHSESGIPEGSYDFWEALFEGFKRAGRKVEIDIHAKGIEQKLLRMALDTGNPVQVSPKYWAEHMGLPYQQSSIREQERVPNDRAPDRIETQRRFTRYGYGDYLAEDREYGVLYRIWPGTQRTLLWGDPAMAAGYGRYAHFCGSVGLELSEPLSFKGRMGSGLPGGRNAYADASLRPAGGDWRKHAYSYRLWGRLLYNPDASAETWRRSLRTEFGPAARDCEYALAHASRVLPVVTVAHHPSASNNSYWPEIYTNMPIVDGSKPQLYRDTVQPARFGTVSSLDPELISSPAEFAGEMVTGPRSGRYSQLDVARWLEDDARAAEEHLAKAVAHAANPQDSSFRRWEIDVAAQSGLGHFFAQKLRAGVAYEMYALTGERPLLERAVKYQRLARDAWARVVKKTDKVYMDDVTYGLTRHLRGHWKDRLPAIEADLASMEKLLASPAPAGEQKRPLPPDIDLTALFTAARPGRPRCEHLPVASFERGKPVVVEMAVESGHKFAKARLHYRHANQAERYRVEDMTYQAGRYRREIPASYSDSPYPLLYFFELFDDHGEGWMYPGFASDLMNQPYFVVRQ